MGRFCCCFRLPSLEMLSPGPHWWDVPRGGMGLVAPEVGLVAPEVGVAAPERAAPGPTIAA